VAGATLLCDRYVSILTGPVVGLVTGDTARILLEVDRTAEITCHVCLVDESCPQGREMQCVKMVLALAALSAMRSRACFRGSSTCLVLGW